MQAGFQLAVELTNVFPVRELVKSTFDYVVSFARELQKSGSDLIVEEDLAALFGRGRIMPDFVEQFKTVTLKDTRIIPLYRDSPIVLDSTPGPTVTRAFRDDDPGYLATVIQLSMLGWTHDRTTLAAALVECMARRFRMKLPNARPEPSFDRLMGTLEICSSQTSSFSWSNYIQSIELRVQAAFEQHDTFLKEVSTLLTFNTLFATIDYLYLVQSLPENRKVTISYQKGFATVIIWAHYLLGLVVLLKTPSGDVWFGSGPAQVMIDWQLTDVRKDPEICLLDNEMKVVLRSQPDSFESIRIEAGERHTLKGFGSTYLRREFNTRTLTLSSSPLYLETAQLITALALVDCKRMARLGAYRPHKTQRRHWPLRIDRWRTIAAARLIFDEIEFDEVAVSSYVERIEHANIFANIPLPRTLEIYIQKAYGNSKKWVDTDFNFIRDLTNLIVGFATVSGVENYAGLPLILGNARLTVPSIPFEWTFATNPLYLVEMDLLYFVSKLLVGPRYIAEECAHDDSVFLVSDFGWSVFLSTVGDNDPAEIQPELLYIRKGVPTDSTSEIRKSRIRDSTGCDNMTKPGHVVPVQKIKESSETDKIRCVLRVDQRLEYYGSRRNDFQLMITFKARLCSLAISHTFERYQSYRNFHKGLWGVTVAPPCEHGSEGNGKYKPASGITSITGLKWDDSDEISFDRICVSLTKGDSRARWLAVGDFGQPSNRHTMLRGQDCCENCAVNEAALQPGKWMVIL